MKIAKSLYISGGISCKMALTAQEMNDTEWQLLLRLIFTKEP